MSSIIQYLDDLHTTLDKHGDPRTNNWLLMSSPFYTLGICLVYVYLVKVAGPRLMEHRKPFQLKSLLIAYNLFQVLFSAWLFYECLMGGWWGAYSFRCQPVDKSYSPTAIRLSSSGWLTGHYSLRCQPVSYSNDSLTIRMVHACWWYYFSKFTEFFDTFFFVLRKKNQHVSTLHVIHHGCMPMSVWFGVKFTPGGHSTFFGLLNTFVHIIMYTYYLLAAFGPQMQKYLWWKKYLTTLQMVQFVAIMVHAFQLLFIDCNYPKAFVWWIGMHAVMFFFLFRDFYRQEYGKKKRREAAAAAAAAAAVAAVAGACHPKGSTSPANGHSVTNGVTNHSNGLANGTKNGSAKSYANGNGVHYLNGDADLVHRTHSNGREKQL